MALRLTDTYVNIVKTIYFQHYARWYAPFVEEQAGYGKFLQQRLREIETEADSQGSIPLNGFEGKASRESRPPPLPSSRAINLKPILVAAFLVVVVCFLLLLFQWAFERDLTTILCVLMASLIVATVSFGLFYPRGGKMLSMLLDFILLLAKKDNIGTELPQNRNTPKQRVKPGEPSSE